MIKQRGFNLPGVAFVIIAIASAASGQSRAAVAEGVDTLSVKAIAEVETKVSLNGRDTIKLMPADHVVPGDEVIYTLEIRNTGATRRCSRHAYALRFPITCATSRTPRRAPAPM